MISASRRLIARSALLLLSGAWLTVSPSARAEETGAETRTIARELAVQGATAFENGDYTTALDRFQRAASLFQAPSITLMEARTLVRLRRFVEALDRYETTQRMALPPDAPEALRLAVADARRESEELRPRTPWLKIIVQGASQEPQVTLDGKPVPSVLLNIERPIDPGPHEVLAQIAGAPPVRHDVSLGEGEHKVAFLQFQAPTAAPEAQPSAGASANADGRDSSRSNLRTWGYVAGGVGAAALGVSAITGIVALNKKSSLEEVCHPGCPPSSESDLGSYRSNRTISYVSLGVGVAALSVGGYILLSGTSEGSHVAAGVGGTNAWISGRF